MRHLAAALLICAACSNDDGGLPALFSPSAADIVVEVDYEDGAEPMTGSVGQFGEVWGFTRSNLEALFAAAPKSLVVPAELDQMENVGLLAPDDYDRDAILAATETHRSSGDTETSRSFYVLFLDGRYVEDGTVKPDVLGVSVAGTRVVALFGPALRSAGDFLRPFVEQSVLVHELGHAVGLVNDGLHPQHDHEDSAHPHHCANQHCVMFWPYDTAVPPVLSFVANDVFTSSSVVYDDDCLADAHAAARQ